MILVKLYTIFLVSYIGKYIYALIISFIGNCCQEFEDVLQKAEEQLLIIEKKLLDLYDLSDMDKLLISKVIQYHLLFAAIYTGESTFYGTYSLLNDGEFIKLIPYENHINFFVDFLEIFTYIDIITFIFKYF